MTDRIEDTAGPGSTRLFEVARDDGRALLTAAQTDWSCPVPHCPEWDTAGLVRHMGHILTWMEAVVTGRERVSRRDLNPAPDDVADLGPWYADHLDRTLAVLSSANPESPCWTFSTLDDHRVGWWWRRLSVEVAIHRWDAQDAVAHRTAADPQPLDGEVAAAGVEEFLIEFLPGLLTHDQISGLNGTLHVHATEGRSEWWTDLDHPGAPIPGHRTGDTAVRGTRSDLLLWLTNRTPAQRLETIGPAAVVERWSQLSR